MLHGVLNWFEVEEQMPLPDKPVLVAHLNYDGEVEWTRAIWIPAYYKKVDSFDDFYSYTAVEFYDHATDTFYWPEGWYTWNKFANHRDYGFMHQQMLRVFAWSALMPPVKQGTRLAEAYNYDARQTEPIYLMDQDGTNWAVSPEGQ